MTNDDEIVSGEKLRDDDPTLDPVALFNMYFERAAKTETLDHTAVALATANAGGAPSVRMVLLKSADEDGFTFYTNLESRKATELAQNPQAAMCFYWDSQNVQLRIEGKVVAVSQKQADAYFASRDKMSQIGAWASQQSRPMEDKWALEKKIAVFTAKFALGKVPRPPFWSGFCLKPKRLEFWMRGAFRLHERIVYDRADKGWKITRLYP